MAGTKMMPWVLIPLLALALEAGTPAQKSSLQPVAADSSASTYEPSPDYDLEAEQRLLAMANRSRAHAGLAPLQLDSSLTLAARAHADAMAVQQQLSHQLAGEPSLSARLATHGGLHLDRAGENVALGTTAEEAHDHLMLSPPHRENLLDPGFNVVGIGVVRSGNRIYLAEDFGHSLPDYTGAQAEQMIADGLNQIRRHAGLPELVQTKQPGLRDAVCSMALEGRLATRPMHDFAQRFSLLSYTNMHPEILPAGIAHMVADRHIGNAAIGTCYARTSAYPNGTYWVGVLLY